jgi:hypothetical protein
MNPEQLVKIEEQIGECILNIFRSDKIKQSDVAKAEIGLKYLRTIRTINYQRFSGLVQFAGLYSAEHREDIAKNIIAPRIQLCGDVTTDPGEIKKVFEKMQEYKEEAASKDLIIQTKENLISDLKDEMTSKDNPKLQELIIDEYKLKRNM